MVSFGSILRWVHFSNVSQFCSRRIGSVLKFVRVSYNSSERVMIAGGLPPMVSSPDLVYQRCFKKVLERNALYYARYPGIFPSSIYSRSFQGDIEIVREVVGFIESSGGSVDLPDGSRLTTRGLQTMGLSLGRLDNSLICLLFRVLRRVWENALCVRKSVRFSGWNDRSLLPIPKGNGTIPRIRYKPYLCILTWTNLLSGEPLLWMNLKFTCV